MARSNRKPTIEDIEAGAVLKSIREAAGVSQEEVAAHLGMTQQNYWKYESGAQRMGKSVYDKVMAFCVATLTAKMGTSSSGFSEMSQEVYAAPGREQKMRKAIEEMKEAILKLEKIVDE